MHSCPRVHRSAGWGPQSARRHKPRSKKPKLAVSENFRKLGAARTRANCTFPPQTTVYYTESISLTVDFPVRDKTKDNFKRQKKEQFLRRRIVSKNWCGNFTLCGDNYRRCTARPVDIRRTPTTPSQPACLHDNIAAFVAL
eukprot:COSAG02_NODE_18699_length_924_cov_1.111515_1_plen_140_part_10